MVQKVKLATRCEKKRKEKKRKGKGQMPRKSLRPSHCSDGKISLLSRHENGIAAEHSNTLEQSAPLERIALCLDESDFDKAIFGNRLEHNIAAESLLTTVDHADPNVGLFGLVVGRSGGGYGYVESVQGGTYGAE
jgi:hypothetical protein